MRRAVERERREQKQQRSQRGAHARASALGRKVIVRRLQRTADLRAGDERLVPDGARRAAAVADANLRQAGQRRERATICMATPPDSQSKNCGVSLSWSSAMDRPPAADTSSAAGALVWQPVAAQSAQKPMLAGHETNLRGEQFFAIHYTGIRL